MDNISIIHVWHEIKENNFEELKNNRIKFQKKLESLSIKNFHSGALLYNEKEVLEYRDIK